MLLRNLATALLEHGKIRTTLAKAKELQPFAEKLITLSKDGWNLDHFRRCLAVLTSKKVAFQLFHEIGPRYRDRPGGYTRIFKLAKVRQGDAAPMAVIALLGEGETIKAPTRPAVVGSGRRA
jgi:large subunit ribosomal protein L17